MQVATSFNKLQVTAKTLQVVTVQTVAIPEQVLLLLSAELAPSVSRGLTKINVFTVFSPFAAAAPNYSSQKQLKQPCWGSCKDKSRGLLVTERLWL
jgi:hypothetical protein